MNRRSQVVAILGPVIIVLVYVLMRQLTTTPADPTGGPAAQVIQTSFDLQARLEELRKEVGFPGATAAFVLPDGSSGRIAVGVVDPDTQEPMPLEGRMLAGSVGKMFVAGVVLDLVGRKILDLDEPLSTYLGHDPWFDRLPNASDLTLRLLMNHASGVPDHLEGKYFERISKMIAEGPDAVIEPRESVTYVLDVEPLFPAGTSFHYSDMNYILAGLAVEAVTGRDYYDLMVERIVNPLGLNDTSPQNTRNLPGLVQGHTPIDNPFSMPSRLLDDHGLIQHNPTLEYCGGGACSSSADLARYAWLLYRGVVLDWDYRTDLLDGVELVGRLAPGRYGLATFMHKGDLGTTLGHTGWYPGYNSAVTYYVDHDIAVAVQVNRDWETEVSRLADELATVIIDTGL